VEIASNAAEKLMHLINDYLDYAKIDAGYLHLDREATDLVAVARRAASSAVLQAGVKNLRLSVDVPAAGMVADADGAKLEQALENLLSNAVKYTDAGTITLSLHADEERARFTVADTGAGIHPKLIPSLFAKYHRLTGEATRAAPGTGLGLLIAKEIVEAHGGRITATSTGVNGEGTSFVIDIPRSTPVSSIEDAKALVAG
jgi:signal transduction histidine kinase